MEALIGTYKPKAYDEAVRILKDLRDLAEYQDKENTFRQRVAKLADRYRRRSSLIARMRQAGLIEF